MLARALPATNNYGSDNLQSLSLLLSIFDVSKHGKSVLLVIEFLSSDSIRVSGLSSSPVLTAIVPTYFTRTDTTRPEFSTQWRKHRLTRLLRAHNLERSCWPLYEDPLRATLRKAVRNLQVMLRISKPSPIQPQNLRTNNMVNLEYNHPSLRKR